MKLSLTLAPLLAAAATLAPPAAAAPQEPRTGRDWYEDAVDIGFKVKAPRDWVFVPGSPMEQNLIGKYTAGNGADVNLGHNAIVTISLYLVKFDRREKPEETRQLGGETVTLRMKGAESIHDWIEGGLDQGQGWHRLEDEDDELKADVHGRVHVYEGMSTIQMGPQAEAQPIRAYAAVFPVTPEVDVALVGTGPADKRKWRSFEKAYASIAKTLKRVEVERVEAATGKDPRSLKRARLEEEVARSPGWSLYETPNYFILSSYDDREFIEELKLRLEAIRKIYEVDFPPDLARKLESRPAEGGPEATPGEKKPDAGRTISVVDPLELGKCSVVRVCQDREQYLAYGAPPSSAGYWHPIEEELVVYDDKARMGRDYTWGVLNHEGFHQYTFAFFGNLAPHSWYNEGIGDYYFGFEFNTKTRKFTREKALGRQNTLLGLRERFVPLKDFVHWTKSQYYGTNQGNGSGGGTLSQSECYAQGWSLIWFLRTGGEERAKGWRDEWGDILPTYTEVLLETGDLEKAVEAAFDGVDWDALQASWADYVM